jgi:hypothetical protein
MFVYYHSHEDNAIFLCGVLLGINPSTGTKVAKPKGRKIRSGVHEAVLSIVRDIAAFDAFD